MKLAQPKRSVTDHADMPVTGSHTGKDNAHMPEKSNLNSSTRAAQKRLTALHDKLGSWQAVASVLPGCNRALLCRIATGKQRAPVSVLRALKLTRRYHDLWEWPVDRLAWAIRERQSIP